MTHVIFTYSHHKKRYFNNIISLRENLKSLKNKGPQIMLLEIQNFGILTLGISLEWRFVEFMDTTGNPLYLLANEKEPKEFSEEYLKYDSGGTPTPIQLNNYIPV
jgi:hypothetical protein